MGWIAHAIVDVALGIGLLIAGIHGSGADYYVLDFAGGYLLVVSVLTKGPGGLWRRLPRLAHRLLDGLVAAALFVSPLIVSSVHAHIDLFATAMAEAVAVIVMRDALLTDHRVLVKGLLRTNQRAAAGDAPIDARAYDASTGGAPAGERARVGADIDDIARRLGRFSARASGQAPEAARRAGVMAGRARRAGRAARQAVRQEDQTGQ